mgnify:CR=1 FL=1
MEKINFINNSQPALNARNLNKLQDNIEDSLNELNENKFDKTSIQENYNESDENTYSCNYINGIIESGSNTNGEWIKYADGTMICYREIELTFNITSSWGSLYYGSNESEINFAQTFIERPTVVVETKPSGAVGMFEIDYDSPVITTSYYKNIYVARPTQASNVSAKTTILAIGKWK